MARALLVAVILIGFCLRVVDLAQLPPGLHVDEAYNLLDARAILAGWRPIFLPENAGREPVYSYLQALLMAGIGDTLWTARLTSAFIGSLTLALVFAMTLRLSRRRDRFGAVVAAWIIATLYWHLHFSRFGIRAILLPPFVALVVWAWWTLFAALCPVEAVSPYRGDRLPAPKRLGRLLGPALVLAVALGTAWYVHPAGRILVLLPLVHVLWYLVRPAARTQMSWAPLRVLILVQLLALVIVAPLLGHWWLRPWELTSHLNEVSILSRGPGVLLESLLRVGGMFVGFGDDAPWRNLPGRPVFGALPFSWPIVAMLFAFLVAVLAGRQWARLLAVGMGVLLAPSVLSSDAPNFSRAIGVIPLLAAALAPTLGWFLGRLWATNPSQRRLTGGRAVVVGVLVAMAFLPWNDYRHRWADDPETAWAMDDEKLALARYLDREEDAGRFVYLSHVVESLHQTGMVEHATVRAAAQHPPRGFDPRFGLVIPPTGTVGAAVYVGFEGNIVPAGERVTVEQGEIDPWDELAYRWRWLWERVALVASDTRLQHELRNLSDPVSNGQAERLTRLKQAQPLTITQSALELRLLGQSAFGLAPRPHMVIRAELQSPMLRGRLQDPESAPRIDRPVWGDAIALVWADVPATVPPGSEVRLTLVWECREPLAVDYNAAIQLVSADGQTSLGSGDGPPIAGSFPTSVWRVGELVVSDYTLRVNEDAAPGPAQIRLGWYDLARVGDPEGSLYAPGGRQVVPVAALTIAK